MPFVWQCLKQAWSSSVASMGTTTLAISGSLLYPLADLIAELWKRGWAGMTQHWKARLQISAMIAAAWWILLFFWHLFYEVPKQITVQAESVSVPIIHARTVLPPNWDHKFIKPTVAHLGRHLTASQRQHIVQELAQFQGQKFVLDCAVNDAEAHRFAADLRDALTEARWQMLSYAPMWDPGFSSAFNWQNFFGVQWFERVPMPAASVFRQTLRECCGIIADGVMLHDRADLEVNVIYIWVGPSNAPLTR